MQTDFKISVVIPTYRRAADLSRCLDSIKQQLRSPDEVIVVVGPGDRESAEVCARHLGQWGNLRAVEVNQPSVVAALNLGLREAAGDIIVFFDDDVFVQSDVLGRLDAHYQTDPQTGAVGGRDLLQIPDRPDLTDPPKAGRVGVFTWSGQSIGNHHCGSQVSPCAVEFIKGVIFSFRRAAFPRLEIDPYLISQGAEVGWEIDLCQSIRRAQWKIIYDDQAVVLHYAGLRLDGDHRLDFSSKSSRLRPQNMAYLVTKYRPPAQALIFVARACLLGSRYQPGLAWGGWYLLRGHPRYFMSALRICFHLLIGCGDGWRARHR